MGVKSDGKAIDLQEIAVITGNHVIPTASLKATVNGVDHVASAVGVGPVDAALRAIMGILPTRVTLKEFKIEAISGGSEAIGHVTVALEDEKGHIFDASGTGDDIVIASVDTDGTDGPGFQFSAGEKEIPCLSGGIVDGWTVKEAREKGVNIIGELKFQTPQLRDDVMSIKEKDWLKKIVEGKKFEKIAEAEKQPVDFMTIGELSRYLGAKI
jgi:putative NIF3 family GTP cyclohydrolase 1 type 2